MEHFSGTEAIGRQLVRPVLTVGNFDGIHLGHRAILDVVVERARSLDGEAVVHTFDPHPRQVLYPERALCLLTTLEQKLELLAAAGVDVAVVEPFTLEYARTSAEVFIRDRLHGCIAPLEVYVGYDFHFGRDREGSMRLLTEMGPRLGFAVTIIPEVTIDAGDVNSTRIPAAAGGCRGREGLRDAGSRVHGARQRRQRGATRSRPGISHRDLDPENEVLPAPGVYAGHARFLDGQAGEAHPVVTNVGTRPTFEDAGRVVAEAHLIDFEGDLYGRRLELSFEQHLRPERRFESVDALRRQIHADVDDGRRRLGVA